MTVKRVCPYPVGSIHFAVDSNDPATIWPGISWERIQDCVLMAAGATYAAGTSGGSATHTLTADEMPSHKHSVGAHSHGLNSHVHSVGAHSHGLNSHTHSYSTPNGTGSTALGPEQVHGNVWRTDKFTGVTLDTNFQAGNTYGGRSAPGKAGSGHTHTTNTTSASTGAASGSTANSAAFNSGAASGSTANSAAFDSGATGGGKAFQTFPPYLTVNVWKRVA